MGQNEAMSLSPFIHGYVVQVTGIPNSIRLSKKTGLCDRWERVGQQLGVGIRARARFRDLSDFCGFITAKGQPQMKMGPKL